MDTAVWIQLPLDQAFNSPSRNNQRPRTCTAPRSWCRFITLAALLCLAETSRVPGSPAASEDTVLASVNTEFESLAVASIFAEQHSRQAVIHAIPVPPSVNNYEELSQLAAMMPPRQVRRRPDVQQSDAELLTTLIPPRLNLGQGQISDHESLEGHTTLRILIVGDSMSQGAEGDYTWRYRIWSWCQEQNISATFVGPYTGTQQPDEPAKSMGPIS